MPPVKKNAGKLPAFQFYPADWRKDPAVQSLDYETRGVWFEILCLMHESDERGVLLLNGQIMPLEALARLLGLDKQILTNHLTKLTTYGVAKVRESDGAIFNKRMVEDERLRQIRAECGKKGGNPILLNQSDNQKPTTQVKQKTTPSSSSSSSISLLPPSQAQSGELFGDIEQQPKVKTAKPKKEPSDSRHKNFIAAFESSFESNTGSKYHFKVQDGVQLAALLKAQPELELQDWTDGIEWLRNKGRDQYSQGWVKEATGNLAMFASKWSQITNLASQG